MKHIGKDAKGKFKCWDVVVESAVYPAMNNPDDAKWKKVKIKLRAALHEAWENGVRV